MSSTHFDSVCLQALLIQDTMRIRRIVICGLTGPTLNFPHFVTNCTNLDKLLLKLNMCFDFLWKVCLKYLSF